MSNDLNESVAEDLDSASGPDLATAQERYSLVVKALENEFAGQLKTVVLFGSQARGSARLDSDHDLYVVVEGLPQDPVARQRTVRSVLLPILDRLLGPISFAAKTPEEMAANLTPLLLDVCVDGVVLYGAAFFEPYRRRALAALRQSGMRRQQVGGTLMWLFDRFPASDWELSWEGFSEQV